MFQDLMIDGALVAGFGVQHSVLATLRAKKVIRQLSEIDPLTWRGPQSFCNVLYVVLAACLWRPVDFVIWNLTGPAYWAMTAVLYAGWVWYFEIHIVEYDCGLAFGSTAAVNRLLGRKSPPLETWKTGMRRWVRFPVHTAFFPMFLAFPRMTADLLVFGVVANLYNWIGTELYDIRLKTLIPAAYMPYVEKTGLIFPPVVKNRRGAGDMEFAEPIHWRRPLANLPGILMGLAGGALYWMLLGKATLTPSDLWLSWGASFLLAIVGGLVLALVSGSYFMGVSGDNLDHFQTHVSTNTALMSAVAILGWFAISLFKVGGPPTLGVILPMWITVLWLGHATAAVAVLVPRKLHRLSASPSGT